MHNAARAGLTVTAADAKGWFSAVVPVDLGNLKDTWFSTITDTQGYWVMLTFGMGGPKAPYAVYVELGTGKMTPRAPLRTTAMEVFPIIGYHIREAYSLAQ
jgi:hypothetical protein